MADERPPLRSSANEVAVGAWRAELGPVAAPAFEGLHPDLRDAFLQDDPNGVLDVVQSDVDAACGTSGHPALFLAAMAGRIAVVAALIRARADVNGRGKGGESPLHAARTGEVARALLAAGADVTCRTRGGIAPLHRAAARGRSDVIAVLLEHGADPRAATSNGGTPLHFAAAQSCATADPSIIGRLVAGGADPDAGDAHGLTALIEAARHGLPVIVSALLRCGASSQLVSAHGTNALHWAVLSDKYDDDLSRTMPHDFVPKRIRPVVVRQLLAASAAAQGGAGVSLAFDHAVRLERSNEVIEALYGERGPGWLENGRPGVGSAWALLEPLEHADAPALEPGVFVMRGVSDDHAFVFSSGLSLARARAASSTHVVTPRDFFDRGRFVPGTAENVATAIGVRRRPRSSIGPHR